MLVMTIRAGPEVQEMASVLAGLRHEEAVSLHQRGPVAEPGDLGADEHRGRESPIP